MSQSAFLIYTRTYNNDYQFSVYPSGIAPSINSSMQKIILEATKSIDTLEQNQVRRVIYSAKGCVLAGMVAFLKQLADGCADGANLFVDAKGRSIYAFVGLVFHTKQAAAPQINKATLWEGFKKYMFPVWERTSFEPQQAEYEDFTDIKTSNKPTGEEKVGGKSFYTINGDDSEVFDYYLTRAAQGEEVSFCSNIVDFRVIKDTAFNIITTTPNLIGRAKRELLPHNQPSDKHRLQREYVNNHWDNLVLDYSCDNGWQCNFKHEKYSQSISIVERLFQSLREAFSPKSQGLKHVNKQTGANIGISLRNNRALNSNRSSEPRKYRIMIWEESNE
ncbi:MAG: hypothetical protein Q4F00_06230 [bacterium]|nr:hypothetical protein [bacterium]